jgi:hypothetical protein
MSHSFSQSRSSLRTYNAIESMRDNELTGYEEHLQDSQVCGDPRRCPHHPTVRTSSDDGMFDGLCGQCEHEADMWEHSQENPHRKECGNETYIGATFPYYHGSRCDDPYTNSDLVF